MASHPDEADPTSNSTVAALARFDAAIARSKELVSLSEQLCLRSVQLRRQSESLLKGRTHGTARG
jgi:hypothetical protein